jgi:hypothetical protein
MADHIVHTLPGQAAEAVTKGLFGKFDDAGKIELCGAGTKADGVITRTVGAGGATGLAWGIINITASEAISAEGEVTTAAAGKGQASASTEWVSARALQTAATADGDSIPALVFGPGGGYIKA